MEAISPFIEGKMDYNLIIFSVLIASLIFFFIHFLRKTIIRKNALKMNTLIYVYNLELAARNEDKTDEELMELMFNPMTEILPPEVLLNNYHKWTLKSTLKNKEVYEAIKKRFRYLL